MVPEDQRDHGDRDVRSSDPEAAPSAAAPALVSAPLALYATALAAAWALGPRGPVYWDSFNYVTQAVHGHVGGLAFGRPLFVLVSHAIAKVSLASGMSVWSLEPLLRAVWLAVSAGAAPCTFVLARALGASSRASAIAGAVVALSPALAHSSAAVMTDGPSLTLTLAALACAANAVQAARDASSPSPRGRLGERAWAAWAGVALGVAFGLREQAAVQGISMALVFAAAPRGHRVAPLVIAVACFAVVAVAPVAYLVSTQPGYLHTVTDWINAMRRERADHPYRARDVITYGAWLVALGPVALAAAVVAWVRLTDRLIERRSVLMAVALPSLVQLLLLGGYQDISYSPRYLLPALPGALAIPAALWLDEWLALGRVRAWVVGVLLIAPVLAAAPVVRARERPLREAVDRLPRVLVNVSPRAVIVSGQACPAIEMVRRLARQQPSQWGATRPEWQTVCPGWSWPADVGARLERGIAEGREVVIDLRDGAWLGPRQGAARESVERWLRRRTAGGEVTVWR